MKIAYVWDTETKQTQIQLVGAAYSVSDTPMNDGSKIFVLGTNDDEFNVVTNLSPDASKDIASKLLVQPASGLVRADLSDIPRTREDIDNGSC